MDVSIATFGKIISGQTNKLKITILNLKENSKFERLY